MTDPRIEPLRELLLRQDAYVSVDAYAQAILDVIDAVVLADKATLRLAAVRNVLSTTGEAEHRIATAMAILRA